VIVRGIGRLGVMATGLGIAAAVAGMASTQAVASANVVDFDPNNFAVSIDGFSLIHEGTATATSTFGNIAIADGAGSDATASGGYLDVASAYGDDSSAQAVLGNLDAAFANGANSWGYAGGYMDTPGNVDLASANGTYGAASASEGWFDQAFENGNLSTAASGVGNGDIASVFGNYDIAGANGYENLVGNNDVALVVGSESYALAGSSFTDPGSFDLAAIFGDSLDASAKGANFLVEILPSLF
jgi:trimeric autotransporter adhesin